MDQVARRKEAFAQRLIRNLEPRDGCMLWTGPVGGNGYGKMTVCLPAPRKRGERGLYFTFGVQRLFLMLRLRRPIGEGMEAGHTDGCPYRNCVLHLEEQTRRDNLMERDQRAKRKKDAACPL